MTGYHPPLAPPPRPADPNRKPSLGWRIRRWLRLKLTGDARRKPPYVPMTEWGKERQAARERRKAVARRTEFVRLQALEDRLTRYLLFVSASGSALHYGPDDVRRLVVDGHLDVFLADVAAAAEEADPGLAEIARRHMRGAQCQD